MAPLRAALLASVLAGCNAIFGLEEATPRESGAGGGATSADGVTTSATAGSGGESTVSSGGQVTATASVGGGAGTGGEGGAGAGGGAGGGATASSASTGTGGGVPCPVVHELVEDFEDYDLGNDPTWEEIYGAYSLVVPVGEDGYALRFEIEGTSEIRTRASGWSLSPGDTVELSARSRVVFGEVSMTRLSLGNGTTQGLTYVLPLSTEPTLTESSIVLDAVTEIQDLRVWMEAFTLEGEGTFDVDDVVVRIRRCR